MKRITQGMLGALFAVGVWGAASAAEQLTDTMAWGDRLVEGKTEMPTADGGRISLEKVKGKKGLLVAFTCNHCPYAKKWQDRLTTLGNLYVKKGIGVIAINANDPKVYEDDSVVEMKKLWSGQSSVSPMAWNFPYAVDETSNIARAFGATKTPEFFLFDKKSRLVYHGALDADADNAKLLAYEGKIPSEIASQQYLKNALDAVVAGKKVERFSTQSFGCGIKFRRTQS